MVAVPSEVSKYMGNAVKLADIWGSILYNVKEYGAKGDGVTDDTSKISSAISAAAVSGGIVSLPPGTYISGNFTVPTNVTLQFANGAKLSIKTGSTVTINGPITAGLQQIFSGSGTAAGFGRCEHVVPQWWGAQGDGATDDTAAFQKAITAAIYRGGMVYVPSVLYWYKLTDTLDVPSAVRIVGENTTFNGSAILKFFMDDKPTSSPAISIHGVDNVTLENLYFLNAQTVNRVGVHINGAISSNSFVSCKNVISSGWTLAFRVHTTWIVQFKDCYAKASTEGFVISGGEITTCLFEHCYAESCVQEGYYVNSAFYTTFINCATDFCSIGYRLWSSNAVTLVGCGCEAAVSTAFDISASTVNIDGFTSVGNGTDTNTAIASMINAVNSRISVRGMYEHTIAAPNFKTASVSIDPACTGEYITCRELLTVIYPKNGRFLFNGQAFTTGLPTGTGWLTTDIGKMVHESNPVEAGTTPNKYIKLGYVRKTAGNGNVLNTDWFELRAFTGN